MNVHMGTMSPEVDIYCLYLVLILFAESSFCCSVAECVRADEIFTSATGEKQKKIQGFVSYNLN